LYKLGLGKSLGTLSKHGPGGLPFGRLPRYGGNGIRITSLFLIPGNKSYVRIILKDA